MISQDSRRAPWMLLEGPDEVADAIVALYMEHGHRNYDEQVTQCAHAVQTAQGAMLDGASDQLVVAALLHDIGHLLENGTSVHPTVDLHHESVGARFLANWFGPAITEPIRLHVEAKRYLCSTESDYIDGLSPASLRSMTLQGGPMDDRQVAAFIAQPLSAAAVRLRLWDDLAKDPESSPERFSDFRDLIRKVLAD